MRLSPHLTFDGHCREAFEAYQRIFGGTMETMLSYGESPMAPQIDAQWHSRIVHATLLFGECELTGVDMLPSEFKPPQGFFVTLNLDGPDKGKAIFEALSEGGQVRLAFATTFWSPGFGVVVDRWGIPWEINSAPAGASA